MCPLHPKNLTQILHLLCMFLLVGCGSKSETLRENSASSYRSLGPSIDDAKREARQLLGPRGETHRAVWDSLPEGKQWSAEVLNLLVVRGKISDSALDIEDFCPGYSTATEYEKATCWLRIVSAMAKYESDFKPGATYLEVSGKTSVGLLMMDPELCPLANSVAKLKNASDNLACGLSRLRRLVARDHFVSGPGYSGAAAYWSVLRAPYQKANLYLGRKPHIQEFTRSYKSYRED